MTFERFIEFELFNEIERFNEIKCSIRTFKFHSWEMFTAKRQAVSSSNNQYFLSLTEDGPSTTQSKKASKIFVGQLNW